jgi:hypothetical protein
MSASEHLLVLFSIVLGLGLTELLSSIHHLLHPRTRVKWHWTPLVWAFLVFIAIVQLWWSMFEFGRASDVPNFFELVLTLLAPVTLYLVATSVLPDVTPGEDVDLFGFYIDNRRRFFGLTVLYLVLIWIIPALMGSGDSVGEHLLNAASTLILLLLMRTTRPVVHIALTVLSAVTLLSFVAAYYLRIG